MSTPVQVRIPGTPPPARPRHDSPDVERAAVERLLPDVLKWLADAGDPDPDEDEVRGELMEACDLEDDGYRIASSLARGGWDPDARLVEILDGAALHRATAHTAAVKAWVRDNEIAVDPPRAVGERVLVHLAGGRGDVVGEVTGYNRTTAEYTVRCPSLGHVNPPAMGIMGIIVAAEDIADAPPQEQEPTP